MALVWTAKTDPFENVSDIHITSWAQIMVVYLQYSLRINLLERFSMNLCGRGMCYENSSVDVKLFIRFQ